MRNHDVIIIGGGPAGSTCAWKLKQRGVGCIIIDRAEFPRLKLCAGWITPKVVEDLSIDVKTYPYRILKLSALYASFYGIPIKISSPQYSIRRYEFDDWLLNRSNAPVITHEVKRIERRGDRFIIDDLFACKYLVGAGGTHCPVYRTFFSELNPRLKNDLVVCRELEFPAEITDHKCYLWFFENKLPGYSWYVPKANGYLNIGVGGMETSFRRNGDSINIHWERLVDKLKKRSLVENVTQPKGHSYYLRQKARRVQLDNAFIIGDSAGLATRDMGEGIGPAVESAIRAAESIVSGKPYDITSIHTLSLDHPFWSPIARRLLNA